MPRKTGSARVNSVQVDLVYRVLLGGALDGTFVNYPTATTIIPDTETSLLVNTTSTTITGGEVVFQGVTSGGGDMSC